MITTRVFALIDRDRRVLRSTDGFRTLSLDVEAACEGSADIERVLSGSTQTATMVIGETELEISAVTDGAGVPHALLRLPARQASELAAAAGSDDWVGGMRGLLEERPVLAWLKDTAGRHLYVNRRYLDSLQVAADRVIGRTDDELAPGESVDGPRRSLAADGIEEPQELEYTVPAFGHRPALAAVRFLARGPDGEVHGICGLAAPLDHAPVVRQEFERIATSRSAVVDPTTQEDLLRAWGVALADGASSPRDDHLGHVTAPAPTPTPGDEAGHAGEPADPDDPAIPPPASEQPADLVQRWEECVQRLQSEARQWQDEVSQSRAVVQEAQEQLTRALAERDTAQQEHERLRGEREELEHSLAAERMRNEELVRTIEQLRVQVSEVGRTLDHVLPGEAVTAGDAQSAAGDFGPGPPEWSG